MRKALGQQGIDVNKKEINKLLNDRGEKKVEVGSTLQKTIRGKSVEGKDSTTSTDTTPKVEKPMSTQTTTIGGTLKRKNSVSQPQSETIEHKSPVSVAADPVSISMEADPVSIEPKSKGKSKRNKKKPKKKT